MNPVNCKLAPSLIHGVGVIAVRDMKAGDRMYCILERRSYYGREIFDTLDTITQELIIERWPHVILSEKAVFQSPNADAYLISFMNHSDTPNYDPMTDTAIRDIKAGEEVTEDYRRLPNYQLAYPWLK